MLELSDKELKLKFPANDSSEGVRSDRLKTFILVDRIVVKSFDDDDIHRLSDSVGTAFYEGSVLLL